MSKKLGTSFPELIIILFIISTVFTVFLRMTSDYIKTLAFTKEMFILNTMLQEKYQLLIGYRNKWLETSFTPSGAPNITTNFNSGNYCLYFSNNTIILNPGRNCNYNLINGRNTRIFYDVILTVNGNITRAEIRGRSSFLNIQNKVEGFLTRWHPLLRP